MFNVSPPSSAALWEGRALAVLWGPSAGPPRGAAPRVIMIPGAFRTYCCLGTCMHFLLYFSLCVIVCHATRALQSYWEFYSRQISIGIFLRNFPVIFFGAAKQAPLLAPCSRLVARPGSGPFPHLTPLTQYSHPKKRCRTISVALHTGSARDPSATLIPSTPPVGCSQLISKPVLL